MSVAAYVYLYWRYDIAGQVREALRVVEGFPVERLWLDCEDATGGLSAEAIVEKIGEAVAAGGDFPCGIYTGRWWWQPATGDSAAFKYLPLWHAEYTSGADVLPSFEGFRPYGGWSRPVMWQFQGTTTPCGVGVDLNLRDVPILAPALGADERWELDVLRAGRRFEQALHNGRFALRPVANRPEAVELVHVEGGRWLAFEPPCVLVVG
jgi:hypothetical protein